MTTHADSDTCLAKQVLRDPTTPPVFGMLGGQFVASSRDRCAPGREFRRTPPPAPPPGGGVRTVVAQPRRRPERSWSRERVSTAPTDAAAGSTSDGMFLECMKPDACGEPRLASEAGDPSSGTTVATCQHRTWAANKASVRVRWQTTVQRVAPDASEKVFLIGRKTGVSSVEPQCMGARLVLWTPDVL
jgi:hypothetical protein